MKTTETVKTKLYDLFELYYTDKIGTDKFLSELSSLCMGKGKKSYWWRFFPNDTLVNDYLSVRADLGSVTNSIFLMENIEIALRDREIIVFYS